jgi:hypothetical protein
MTRLTALLPTVLRTITCQAQRRGHMNAESESGSAKFYETVPDTFKPLCSRDIAVLRSAAFIAHYFW